MNCKNCDKPLTGNYCSNCGQKARVDKIDAKYLLNEIPETFFQVNHGFLFTIKEILLNPGNTIRNYLHGKRKNYIKPIAYVLLLSTLYALLASLVSGTTFLGEIVLGLAEGGTSKESDPIFSLILQWIADNYAYSTVLFLPFFSLASFLAFKKFNYNFFEHFVINAYLSGQQAIIYSIFVLIQYFGNIENYYYPLLSLVLSIVFAFWTFIQLFKSAGTFSTIIRTVITYFLYFIIIVTIFIIGFAIEAV